MSEYYDHAGRSSVSVALAPSVSIATFPPTAEEQASLVALGTSYLETYNDVKEYMDEYYDDFGDFRGPMNQWFSSTISRAMKESFSKTISAYNRFKMLADSGVVNFEYAVALIDFELALEFETRDFFLFEGKSSMFSSTRPMYDKVQYSKEQHSISRMRELYFHRRDLMSATIKWFKHLLATTLGLVQQVQVSVGGTFYGEGVQSYARAARQLSGSLTEDDFSENTFVEFVKSVQQLYADVMFRVRLLYYEVDSSEMRRYEYYNKNVQKVKERKPLLFGANQLAEFALEDFKTFQEKTGYVIL